MDIWRTIILLFLMLAVFAGIIILQIFLSKKESKWPGLILPFISLGADLVIVLGVVLFSVVGEPVAGSVNGAAADGRVYVIDGDALPMMIIQAVNILLLFGIPTVVLFAVYAACRGKRKKRRALDKMNVQDLN